MRTRELERFKKSLLKKRKEMLEEMGEVIDKTFATTLKESTGELSSHTYHMADQGTDAMEREMQFASASKSGRLVYHLDEALRRIENGTYGKCHSCGKQINLERLKAVPHASFCIECKELQEVKKTERK
jgi:RNA polymerase-binding protein DksA